ncbi:MAG: hypothetical protein DMG07_10220, partial [Acidobacteria bacterium]
MIPGASVIATNLATNQELRTITTETGNFTIPALSAGNYSLTVEQPGFRKFVQTGITVQVAQTLRIDVSLQVGAVDNQVTVNADAPLLRTESAEQSTVLSGDKVNQLPLNFANNGVRNPLVFLQLAPGTSVGGWNDIRVNGSPRGTFRVIFEGQDSTSALNPRLFNESQPSIDGVEEFTLQSTNYSAEFGQVGGGLVNFTARSGTKDYHGTAYEYLNNEALNAAPAFSPIAQGGSKAKTRIRQHDFGGTFGGPVRLPKIYDGRNRTFVFFNIEVYHQKENRFNGFGNLPNAAYRNGDFSNLLTGRVLATDPLGRSILEGAIYDPTMSRIVDGKVVRDPFPGNRIPTTRFDPIAAKIQNLFPSPDPAYADRLVNNFERRFSYRRIEQIPSWKVDHNFSARNKLAVYFGMQRTRKDNGQDGLPDPISQRRDQPITSKTIRVSHDYFFTPTMINHFGIGYQRYYNPDTTPITTYDAEKELGLKGAQVTGFPRLTGLQASDNLGPTNYQLYTQDKPTVVESFTWVRRSHTLKFGGEWRIDTFNNLANNGATGTYNFAAAQTGLPSTEGQNLQGGTIGYGYASFLLGLVSTASINNPTAVGFRRTGWSGFVQDSWKLTPKLTLELGLRYDLQRALHALYYRTTMFSPQVVNPAAGGRRGGSLFACYGPAYPYAFGPRLGFAYSFNPKTVLRGGWGLTYGSVGGFNYIGAGNSLGFGFNRFDFSNPAFGEAAVVFKNGLTYDSSGLYAQNISPGIRPSPGALDSPPAYVDPNGGRPPRVNNWVLNVQREVTRNLVVEAAYVGNRGVWFEQRGLVDLNAIDPASLKARGLDVTKAEDQAVLTSRLNSPLAQSRGFGAPYPGYPLTATVAQSLRPYPQFGGIGIILSPLGNTWYDSLQVKATQRLARGLDFILAYTWSKNLATVTEQGGGSVPLNNIFDRGSIKTLSPNDQPHIFVASFRYEAPALAWMRGNAWKRAAFEGWNVSGIFRYASGEPILIPNAQNSLGNLIFRSTYANRVAGEPLFTKDLNCGCIDANRDFVLNPKAWADAPPGTFGVTSVYQSDYRTSHNTSEDMSFGKLTRFGERTSL